MFGSCMGGHLPHVQVIVCTCPGDEQLPPVSHDGWMMFGRGLRGLLGPFAHALMHTEDVDLIIPALRAPKMLSPASTRGVPVQVRAAAVSCANTRTGLRSCSPRGITRQHLPPGGTNVPIPGSRGHQERRWADSGRDPRAGTL